MNSARGVRLKKKKKSPKTQKRENVDTNVNKLNGAFVSHFFN